MDSMLGLIYRLFLPLLASYAGNLACWTRLRSSGAQTNPPKINTVMFCHGRISAGGPGFAQEIKRHR